jgi:hypothetical protein
MTSLHFITLLGYALIEGHVMCYIVLMTFLTADFIMRLFEQESTKKKEGMQTHLIDRREYDFLIN